MNYYQSIEENVFSNEVFFSRYFVCCDRRETSTALSFCWVPVSIILVPWALSIEKLYWNQLIKLFRSDGSLASFSLTSLPAKAYDWLRSLPLMFLQRAEDCWCTWWIRVCQGHYRLRDAKLNRHRFIDTAIDTDTLGVVSYCGLKCQTPLSLSPCRLTPLFVVSFSVTFRWQSLLHAWKIAVVFWGLLSVFVSLLSSNICVAKQSQVLVMKPIFLTTI